MTVIKGAVDNSELKSRESFLNVDTYNGVEDRLSLGYKDKDGLKYVRSFVLEKERKLDGCEDNANYISIQPSTPTGASLSIATITGQNCNPKKSGTLNTDEAALLVPIMDSTEQALKNSAGLIRKDTFLAFKDKVDSITVTPEYEDGLYIGKIDSVKNINENSTNNLYVPVATDEENGVIKLGFSTDDADRNYAVELDDDGKAFVNVPWIEYENATTENDGLMSKEDKTKIDSVEENANFYEHPEITPSTVNDETITFGETTVITGVTANENGHITSISGGLLPEIPQASEESLGLVKSSITGDTPDRDYNVQVNEDGTMKVNVPWTDNNTTYESLAPVESGTDTSLVTTGEKNYWNLKAGIYNTSMVALGFTARSTIDVATFLDKIRTTYGSHCIVTFDWGDAHAAYISDGTNTTELVSGCTLFVGLNYVDASSTTAVWKTSGALLVGNSTQRNVYVLTSAIHETAGRVVTRSVRRLALASEILTDAGSLTCTSAKYCGSSNTTNVQTALNNLAAAVTALQAMLSYDSATGILNVNV